MTTILDRFGWDEHAEYNTLRFLDGLCLGVAEDAASAGLRELAAHTVGRAARALEMLDPVVLRLTQGYRAGRDHDGLSERIASCWDPWSGGEPTLGDYSPDRHEGRHRLSIGDLFAAGEMAAGLESRKETGTQEVLSCLWAIDGVLEQLDAVQRQHLVAACMRGWATWLMGQDPSLCGVAVVVASDDNDRFAPAHTGLRVLRREESDRLAGVAGAGESRHRPEESEAGDHVWRPLQLHHLDGLRNEVLTLQRGIRDSRGNLMITVTPYMHEGG